MAQLIQQKVYTTIQGVTGWFNIDYYSENLLGRKAVLPTSGVNEGMLYFENSQGIKTHIIPKFNSITQDLLLNSSEEYISGGQNISIGSNSFLNNIDGSQNVAVGGLSLQRNTIGNSNTSIGYLSLPSNTTGNTNTATGCSTLFSNTSGASNTAMGINSLYSNTTGNLNTAVGCDSLHDNISGGRNTAIGEGSLKFNRTTGGNTAVGSKALENNISFNNAAIGAGALQENTSGSNNSALGYTSLKNLVDYNNCTGIGFNSQVTGSNQVQLGNSDTTTYAYGTVQNRSDERDKADILDLDLGLNFIKELKPRKFKWDYREDYGVIQQDGTIAKINKDGKLELDSNNKPIIIKKDGSKKRQRYHNGFIAQEVKAIMDKNKIDFAGYQDHSKSGGKNVLSLGYEEFIAPMIKAIQEQQIMIEDLQKQVKELSSKK